MPIPDFATGGILPAGIHDCDLTEIESLFVYNDSRKNVWNGFMSYLSQITAISEVNVIYVDGSFTTDKETFADNNESPNDVDIVLEFADVRTLYLLVSQYPLLFDRPKVKQNYNVDLLFWFDGITHDLREFFQYLRPEEATNRNVPSGTKKGILRISLDNERQRKTIK